MKLGLIGGVSPYAYADIYLRICDTYRQSSGAYPEIVSISLYVTEQEEKLFMANSVDDSLRETFVHRIRSACCAFRECGIQAVGICCNTLSALFLEICKEFDFDVVYTPLSLVVEDSATRLMGQKCLVIASGYTYELLQDINAIDFSEQEVAYIEHFLLNQINGKSKYDNVFLNLIERYYDIVDAILLVCTDVTVESIAPEYRAKVIDSVKLFCDKCITVLEE